MRRLIAVGTTAIALSLPQQPTEAEAHRLPHRSFKTLKTDAKVRYLRRQIHHDKSALRFWHKRRSPHHYDTALRARDMRWHRTSLRIALPNLRRYQRIIEAARAARAPWDWYYRADTQCVVNHEGGWTSVNPAGYYGRFQADVSFQLVYGAQFYRRWGTANNWPPYAQVIMGYRGYQARGWGPWPTYYAFCT